MTKIKFDVAKVRVDATPRKLNMTNSWDPAGGLPEKSVRTGIDKLHRHYAVLQWFSDAEKSKVIDWLDQTFPESWVGLGDTIWFDNEADLAFFILRWS